MASSSKNLNDGEIVPLLLLDIEKSIPIINEISSSSSFVPFCSVLLCSVENQKWGKSLKEMPLFTIKDIDKHRLNSGKTVVTKVGNV